MRSRMRLSEFDFDIIYKKLPRNTRADAIFFLRSLRDIIVPVDEDIPTYALHFNQPKAAPNDLNGVKDLKNAPAWSANTAYHSKLLHSMRYTYPNVVTS